MSVELLTWLTAGIFLLVGGVLGLLTRRNRLWLPMATLAAGLLGVLAGLGWRAWTTGAWPGVDGAEALAMLAGGALVVTAWAAPRWTEPLDGAPSARSVAFGCALFGAAALTFSAAALAWPGADFAATAPTRSWLYGLRGLLASIGLGGWLPVLAGSAWGLWSAGRRGVLPGPAADRGRMVALFSYPWLTAALLAGMLWNLAARAAILTIVPGELWLVVAWLLGATYLHATSSWRPRRLAAWLGPVIAALALAAAVLSAINVW